MLGLISALVASRVFGVEAVGALALVTVLTGVLHLVSNVQELGGLVRELTRHEPGAPEPRALMWATLGFSVLITAAVLVPFSVLAVYVLRDVVDRPELLEEYFVLAAAYLVLDNTAVNFAAPLAAFRDGRSLWIAHALTSLTMIAAALACAVLGLDTLTGLIGCTLAASAASLGYRMRAVRRLIGLRSERADLRRVADRMRAVLGFGVRAAPVNITEAAIGYFDTVTVGAYETLASVGAYSRAYGLYQRLGQIPVSLSQLFFPTMSALHHRGDVGSMARLHRLASRYLLVVLAPVAAWIAACAPGVLDVFGPGFDRGADALSILVFVVVLDCISRPAGGALWAADRPGVVSIVHAVVAAVNIVLCLILIPPYGLTGAAAANLAGWAVAAIALPILAARTLERPRIAVFDLEFLVRLAGCCAVVALVAVPLREADGALALQALAGVPSTLAGLLLFRPLSRADGPMVERALDAAHLRSSRLRRGVRLLHRLASRGPEARAGGDR